MFKRKYYGIRKKWWKRKRNEYIAWSCFTVAAVLIGLFALYITVWSVPKKPVYTAVTTIQSAKPTVSVSPTKTTAPQPTPKPVVVQDSFLELVDQNPDIVGWIAIENTKVDYPVMQADDNDFYMDRDFEQNEHVAGSLFLDYRCDITNMYQAAHQIIYGHNMKNGSMFQGITQYEDETFFKENSYITLNTLYGNYTFEVFSAYETPISFYYLKTDFVDREAWLDFIQLIRKKSMVQSDVKLTQDDVVLTLSTCTNAHDSNMRFVVHAKLINPELYDQEYAYMY